MFENIGTFFKKIMKNDTKELVSDTTAVNTSKDAAKERLQLVLMQDRANVSADFLELMKQEIIDVIKKYIVVEEDTIDVRIINQENEDGTNGAPSLCANIPILNIRNDNKSERLKEHEDAKVSEKIEEVKPEEVIEPENNIIAEENNVEENVKEEIIETTEIEEKNEENKFKEVVEEVKEEINEISEDILEALSEGNEEESELDDEDDDDVTFDDLLKAAEEEEKMQEQTKDAPKPKSASRRNTSKNKNKRKKVNKK